jgi:hypothetical protein
MKTLRFIIAAGLFLVTSALAVWNGWNTADIVWSSWIASVVVGIGLMILSQASFSLFLASGRMNLRYGCAIVFLFVCIPPWVVLHGLTAVLLYDVFPLLKTPLATDAILYTTLTSYWPFVLASAASEFARLRSYWRLAEGMRAGGSYPFLFQGQIVVAAKMFLFVWLLAALGSAGLAEYALYPALVFYFFPWDAVAWRLLLRRGQGKQPSRDPDQLILRFGGGMFSAIGWPCLLAGLFFLSLPFWREGMRSWGLAVTTGLVLTLVGAVLAFGRDQYVFDRRDATLTDRLSLGIIRFTWKHNLQGIGSVQLERVAASFGLSGRFEVRDGQRSAEGVTLMPRGGRVGTCYHVSLMRGASEAVWLEPLSLMDARKARGLAEDLAAFLDRKVAEKASEMDQYCREEPEEPGEGPKLVSPRAPPETCPPGRLPMLVQTGDARGVLCTMQETGKTFTLSFRRTRFLLGLHELALTGFYLFGAAFIAAFLESWLPLVLAGLFVAVLVLPGKLRDLLATSGRPCLIYDKPNDTLRLPRAGREIKDAAKRVALSIRQQRQGADKGPFELVAVVDGDEEIPVLRLEGRSFEAEQAVYRLHSLGVEYTK